MKCQWVNISKFVVTVFLNPIPTSQGRNQPLYERHMTKSGWNRVKYFFVCFTGRHEFKKIKTLKESIQLFVCLYFRFKLITSSLPREVPTLTQSRRRMNLNVWKFDIKTNYCDWSKKKKSTWICDRKIAFTHNQLLPVESKFLKNVSSCFLGTSLFVEKWKPLLWRLFYIFNVQAYCSCFTFTFKHIMLFPSGQLT